MLTTEINMFQKNVRELNTELFNLPWEEMNLLPILVNLDTLAIKFTLSNHWFAMKLERGRWHVWPSRFRWCKREIQRRYFLSNSYNFHCHTRSYKKQGKTFFQADEALLTLIANCGLTAFPTSISWLYNIEITEVMRNLCDIPERYLSTLSIQKNMDDSMHRTKEQMIEALK